MIIVLYSDNAAAPGQVSGARSAGKADAQASAGVDRMQPGTSDTNGIIQSPTAGSIMEPATTICQGVWLLCTYRHTVHGRYFDRKENGSDHLPHALSFLRTAS